MCVHKITYKKVNFSINCVFLVRTTPVIITSHEPKPDLKMKPNRLNEGETNSRSSINKISYRNNI